MDIFEALEGLEDDVLKAKCYKAIAAIQRTLDLYGVAGTAFSFNGGKDSTALLQLIRAAVAQQRAGDVSNGAAASGEADTGSGTLNGATPASSRDGQPAGDATSDAPTGRPAVRSPRSGNLGGIFTFVFHSADDFSEIRDFAANMDRQYGLGLQVLTCDFKAGLTQLVMKRGVKAIFLGTRRGDPNAEGQEFFCPSSVGWPPFMRVNPVLDWTYTDVWSFLRATHAPYCALYDCGYTSIGSTGNTEPNSALKKADGSFAPAHVLADGRLERAGRASGHSPVRQSTASSFTCSAGLVIVGDEILAAKVDDVNTKFLCTELRALGWLVKKVAVVPDDVAAIAAETHSLSQEMDLVITTGGVGPTLDDVTIAGVAAAFGTRVARHPELEHSLRLYFGDNLTDAHLKMAEVPEGECELIEHAFKDGKPSPFPVLRVRNVYILPGVPHLLKQKWRTLREQLARGGEASNPWRSIMLKLLLSDETKIAPLLQRLRANMPDMLSIGCYPVIDSGCGSCIVLNLEGKDVAVLKAARDFLYDALPPSIIACEDADWEHL